MNTSSEREYRVAVGAANERRSTVWKYVVRKNDAYIFTRMFGGEAKVSFHESGAAQWSATSKWVLAEPQRKNADRHIVKWIRPTPLGKMAVCIFRTLFLESELRLFGSSEDSSSISWLPAPTAGNAVSIECYLTPPTVAKPEPTGPSIFHLTSLPLSNGSWLVLVANSAVTLPSDLQQAKAAMLVAARAEGLVPAPEHRAALFYQGGDAPGLVEVAVL